jgi:hypothetical protein
MSERAAVECTGMREKPVGTRGWEGQRGPREEVVGGEALRGRKAWLFSWRMVFWKRSIYIYIYIYIYDMGRTAGHDLDHLVLVQHVVHRQHVHLHSTPPRVRRSRGIWGRA